MFGPCKACAAHQEHIQSLKAEVAHLQKLLNPEPGMPQWNTSAVQADAMLSGATIPSEDEVQAQIERDAISSEAMRLLTATY